MTTASDIHNPRGEKAREQVIENLAARGFSTYHLIDLKYRIPEIVARTYAAAIKRSVSGVDKNEATEIVINSLTYDGEEVSGPLALGLEGLPRLGRIGADALEDISFLLLCFATFTHSYPNGFSTKDWFNLLNDIGVELKIQPGVIPYGADMRQDAIARLIKIFPHLWS